MENQNGTLSYKDALNLTEKYLEFRNKDITDPLMNFAGQAGVLKATVAMMLSGESPASVISYWEHIMRKEASNE